MTFRHLNPQMMERNNFSNVFFDRLSLTLRFTFATRSLRVHFQWNEVKPTVAWQERNVSKKWQFVWHVLERAQQDLWGICGSCNKICTCKTSTNHALSTCLLQFYWIHSVVMTLLWLWQQSAPCRSIFPPVSTSWVYFYPHLFFGLFTSWQFFFS